MSRRNQPPKRDAATPATPETAKTAATASAGGETEVTLAHHVRLKDGKLLRAGSTVAVGGDFPAEYLRFEPLLDIAHPANKSALDELAERNRRIAESSRGEKSLAVRTRQKLLDNIGKRPPRPGLGT